MANTQNTIQAVGPRSFTTTASGSLVDTAGALALGYAGAKAWNKHPILGAIGGVVIGGWFLTTLLNQVFSVAGPDKVVE